MADINVINDMFNNEVSSDNSIEEYIYKLMADKDLERLKFYFSIMGESYLKVLVFKKLYCPLTLLVKESWIYAS